MMIQQSAQASEMDIAQDVPAGETSVLLEWFHSIQLDHPLLGLAIVLMIGIIGGELFALIRLPKVTGWIATGIILRQLSLPGLDAASLTRFTPLMSFVLGFIAFTVGATLYFASLRNAGRRIGFLLLGELLITPTIVGLSMVFVGSLISSQMEMKSGLLLAAIAIAGAPGTTVLVIQEARARGILTRTLLAAIGLIDMVAVGVFVFIASFVGDNSGWTNALGLVGVQFGISFAIGAFWACIALVLTRTIVGPAFLGPVMVAVILGTWGTAVAMGVSGILACTFAGIVVTNLRHDTVRSTEAYMHSISGVLFAMFFTLAGMKLDFAQVPAAAGLVGLFFAARMTGKFTSAFLAMRAAGMSRDIRNYLGIALLPHGGVAVGLILLVQENPNFESIEGIVTTVGLAALAINQLLGPSATRFALQRAGEDHKDRDRLLDFLQEQRIVTDLTGNSVEEVVRRLSSLLYETSNMSIEQEEYIRQVLDRDAEETTCLGEGLMIPHAILPGEDTQIKGVLGISRPGLDLNAPDQRPVHAVLLLATPESQRNLHLEILAAFATAITRDLNLREQLYHARNPARAYEVLHAEDAEDLNYFLEDAFERAGMLETSSAKKPDKSGD
ncbi:MAG: cation:proton antiporter [Planctomycetota bacterium]|nr:cation:proton antiporter [Planctomycetota bacterium]